MYPMIPHMLVLASLCLLPSGLHPAWLDHLPRTTHDQRPRGDVLRDHRAGADDDALPDADRRDERHVAPDKDLITDHRVMLVRAVVITGDRARADIHPRANCCIAEVGEM